LHFRFDFLQLRQLGRPSSHFKCRSRHVKHPVLTRFGFGAVGSGAATAALSALLVDLGLACRVPEFGVDLVDGWFVIADVTSGSTYGGVGRVDLRVFALGGIESVGELLELKSSAFENVVESNGRGSSD
jgi:hypothetical protein